MRNSSILFIFVLLFSLHLNLQAQQTGPAAQHPDLQKLINTDKVYGMPASATLPDELRALQSVFNMTEPGYELVKLYRYGSTAGRIYALIGLKAIASPLYSNFKTDFNRKDQGSIKVVMPGMQEQTLNARDFLLTWETDADAGKSYTQVK